MQGLEHRAGMAVGGPSGQPPVKRCGWLGVSQLCPPCTPEALSLRRQFSCSFGEKKVIFPKLRRRAQLFGKMGSPRHTPYRKRTVLLFIDRETEAQRGEWKASPELAVECLGSRQQLRLPAPPVCSSKLVQGS